MAERHVVLADGHDDELSRADIERVTPTTLNMTLSDMIKGTSVS